MRAITTKPTIGLTKDDIKIIKDFRTLFFNIQNLADDMEVIIENFDAVEKWIPIFLGEKTTDEIDFVEVE